jgi:cell division septation protein DedD
VPSRTYVVQVAAVSHQTDADNLVGALRRKGIAANSYPGTQDNLIHVQVGPFSSQKDAAAMRDHLSDEGYLAIVK